MRRARSPCILGAADGHAAGTAGYAAPGICILWVVLVVHVMMVVRGRCPVTLHRRYIVAVMVMVVVVVRGYGVGVYECPRGHNVVRMGG